MQGNRKSKSAAITISGDFIYHVRSILQLSLDDVKTGKGVRQGINGYSIHALPAYVSAVAAVEAFINEALLSQLPKMVMKDSPLWNLPADWLEERLEIRIKLVLVSQLLFGKSFKRNAQPYQDMDLLVQIRNDLVHYKMGRQIPNYLGPLDNRGITLRSKGKVKESGADFAWPHKLSCTEGVRWAHNTVCKTVAALLSFATNDCRKMMKHVASNFRPISKAEVIKWYKDQGIDPTSSHPLSE